MNKQTIHNENKAQKPQRFAFLLNLWCEDQTGGGGWRASLEQPGTGKRIGFATLEQLFMYLVDYTENRMDGPENESGKEVGERS